ncbi:MAG: hypothetical protein K8R74_15755 [Bacteroidales bacterium]|nr:hypothetical protein [Bacteroidales bacterium]
MIKKILILSVFAVFFAACNNTQNPSTDTETAEQEIKTELVSLTIAGFDDQAGDFVGKEVQISGLVNHACKHGGKRMFIIDPETEQTVKIEAGENITSFDAELEGSDVLVTGIVNELIIDEAYLLEWEAEIEEEMNNPTEEVEEIEPAEGEEEAEHAEGEGEHEHAGGGLGEKADMGEHISGLEKIENYRNQIKESGKDHLSFYSIECISFEIIPIETEE